MSRGNNSVSGIKPRGMVRCAGMGAAVLVLSWMAGCASSLNQAPVEERPSGMRGVPPAQSGAPVPVPVPVPVDAAKPPLPGAENAGKPGYYTVRPGDTLIRIALDNGQNVRDIARWNNIENPNLIEVGQVVRVVAPGVDPSTVAVRPVSPVPRPDPRASEPRAAAGHHAPADRRHAACAGRAGGFGTGVDTAPRGGACRIGGHGCCIGPDSRA